MSITTLILDDEESVRRSIMRLLQRQGHWCAAVASAAQARIELESNTFDLLLCDVNMPGESGLELVKDVVVRFPDLAVVMVTAVDDPELAGLAIEAGVCGYIVKPFTRNEILINVAGALHRKKLEAENHAHLEALARTIRERTEDLWSSSHRIETADRQLRASVEELIQRLSTATEVRDPQTAGHIERMSRYCELIAREAGLNSEQCAEILIASRLHDVGKIGIPDRILRKKGVFSETDREVMSHHPEIGHAMFEGTGAELLVLAGRIALTHHERWDGSGYPHGLSGESIPLEGRIAAIADVFDALMSKRPYKPAWPIGQIVETMRAEAGTSFDPALTDLFFGRLDAAASIAEQHPD